MGEDRDNVQDSVDLRGVGVGLYSVWCIEGDRVNQRVPYCNRAAWLSNEMCVVRCLKSSAV